jgi:hypothetical protein
MMFEREELFEVLSLLTGLIEMLLHLSKLRLCC